MNAQQLRELQRVNLYAITYGNHSVQSFAKMPAHKLDAWQQHENIKRTIDEYIIRRFAIAAHYFANIINMQHQP